MTTYLAQTAFEGFSRWLLAPFTDAGTYTSKFKIYARGDGKLQSDELLAPVKEYVSSKMLNGKEEVEEGGEVHLMMQAADAWLKEAELRRQSIRRKKEAETRYKSGGLKTKVKKIPLPTLAVHTQISITHSSTPSSSVCR